MSKYWTDDEPQLGWTDWRPVHAPTCRKGGCPVAAAEESEWCPTHLGEVSSQRAATGPQQRVGGRERWVNKQTMSISRAFGKVVMTLHGDVDAALLRRTLTDLAEDQGSLHLIIDLRDAGMLDRDSVAVLVGSAQRVRRAGGDLVLTARSRAVTDALEENGISTAESGPGSPHGGPGRPESSLPTP